ncbi:MAG: hypothetical protein P1U87_03175 [Verrucomicrobiales bacterium]|nr:hypothetical protein [Verrucomicrobiales bacterium]
MTQDTLKNYFGTNPRCRRLGPWPDELITFVSAPEFPKLEWCEITEVLLQLKLTKFCDFKIVNLIRSNPYKHTFEARILPVWLEAERIVDAAALLASILDWAKSGDGKLKEVPDDLAKDFAIG